MFFDYCSPFFAYIWPLAGPNIAEKGAALVEKAPGRVRDGFGMGLGKAENFGNAGFWRLRAPETSIWAPEGAFGPKKVKFSSMFLIFSGVAGSRRKGHSWPFGRMGNVNWVISRFRSQNCTQLFLAPRTSDFGPQTPFPIAILI